MTVHQRDHDQFKPVARPNVRLHGLGIMNAMQGVRLDPVTTTNERKSIENGILRPRRLRGSYPWRNHGTSFHWDPMVPHEIR